MKYLLSKQLEKLAKYIISKYTKKQMVQFIKYKILTDPKWRQRALQRLGEEQLNQNMRVMNNQERLKNRGFDKHHKDDLLNCYLNNLPLDNRLIQKLSTFAGQIFKNLLKNNGEELLYKAMNKDINYLSRNNLKPQPFKNSNENLTETNKKVELQKLIDIIKQNPISSDNSFYSKTINLLNKIHKDCDMKTLKTAIDRYDYEQLQKIINILEEHNWNYFDKEIRQSLQKNEKQTNYLPMFWKFNIFEFIKNVEQTYEETKKAE